MENLLYFTQDTIRNHLKNKHIEFVSTHKKLSLPIINRIYRKMKFGIRFDDIKVYDRMIIDGHHRYISSILAEIEIDRVQSQKTSASVEIDWDKVEFVDEEWDTVHKIQQLNELDAEFNNIPLEQLIMLTKTM